METKNIEVMLIKHEDNIVLKFLFENSQIINLENDDAAMIQSCFLEIAKELKTNNINFNLSIHNSVTSKSDLLFIDTAKEYIGQLNNEIKTFENDEDLQKLRAKE